jgi:hypothetical protein
MKSIFSQVARGVQAAAPIVAAAAEHPLVKKMAEKVAEQQQGGILTGAGFRRRR